MSSFIKFRLLILIGLSVALSACVTLPGHRHIVDEENFFLHISAANLQIKNQIRFNSDKTDVLYLPDTARIKLVVTDNLGKHQLTIKKYQGSVVYDYRLNGRETTFSANEKLWFASQIPMIIDKTGLKYGLEPV